jgi:pimeloyl-ACP methyl ester carboxylesterase
MSLRRCRTPIAAVMSASLLAGLAVAGSSGATTADTVAETSVATISESAPVTTLETAAVSSWEPGGIEWTELSPGFEEGYLDVPIDYADPSDDVVRLYLTRRLAGDPAGRVGSLLVNPGGPGYGGSDFVNYANQVFDAEVLEAFDIVGFDPRGTGLSEPAIDCIDDYDHFYASADITPDDDAERQQIVDSAEEFADACVANNAEIIQFVGTNNAARDIDSIRRALGEEEISYVGFSYGSALGGAWATMFPTTVRAAVFDAAPDPNADELQGALQQVEGFEDALTAYLAQCSADPACAFHNDGDAEGAFDELMLQLDADPIPSIDGRPSVTRGVALNAVAQAMYGDALWPELSAALSSAQSGNGAGLLRLYDSYFGYNGDGTWGNELEAFQTIHCMDTDQRLSVEEEDATAPMFTELAPRFAPPGTLGSYFCTFFPASTDPLIEITGDGAGPILVCGATGDASTPLQGTRAMADALEDSHLIVVDAISNGCSEVSRCADDLISAYLVDLDLPAAKETDCPPE